MLVVNRFRVDEADAESFREQLARAHDVLAACPGYVGGTVGRNLDDQSIWLLTAQWENVGSYRRALSSYDVKVHAMAVLAKAIDEPSAYEVVTGSDDLNRDVPRRLR
ncbi:MAG: antibiotic biosynthesis monooxygenase [Actinomycetota bacterium]|nr:antibiotic biosynthesis monooxygenase [Actinomycetota bacterium]